MAESNVWKKIANLRPSLPRHIQFQRRDYNNERWYLLQDNSNGRFHRLSPSAYLLLCLMDGRKTLQQILDAASAPELYDYPEEVPTREELTHLMQYLHVADLLLCDIPPNTQELFTRQKQKSKQRWMSLLVNPLTWKITLGNPDRLLARMMPLARLISTRTMGIIWLLIVGYALLEAGNHWTQLTHGQLDRILSPGNLLLLWFTYPLLKVVHELGHGLFTKAWGGHVNEFGLVFIMGTPMPYVDASAATAFPSKTQRMMVSAAGMAVEIFFAALSLLLWLQLEPGLLRDILYNIMIIGGVSTLFFNGNPLMRFDGYHLFTDLLDVPNLGSRANQQLSYLVRRYAYGMKGLFATASSALEGWLLVIYSVASFMYRLSVLFVIILLVTNHFPQLGLVVGAWLITFQLLWPFSKYLLFLAKGKPLEKSRKRAIAVASSAAAILLICFVAIPVPMSTSAEGVLWLPDDARVKAESSGEIVELLVANGASVTQGQPLLRLMNTSLPSELAFKQASLHEYEARYQEAWADDRAQAQLLLENIKSIKDEIEFLQKRVDNLLVRSPSTGYFRISTNHELIGSYLKQGESIGIIDKVDAVRIRAAVTQQEIGLIRESVVRVEVKLAANPSQLLSAQVSQQVPAATVVLPSPVLGVQGGGRLAVDTAHPDGTHVADNIFLVDLSIPDYHQQGRYGERAYVKFIHPAKPLALQLYRAIQQIFIRSFS